MTLFTMAKNSSPSLSPRATDGCIAPMMHKPNGARLTSDAALLLS